MAKKKIRNLSDLGEFIFSTNDNFKIPIEEITQTLANNEQYLEAHFSNKGRGGKIVTVVKGFVGKEEDLKELGKNLKTKCGVGGSVKNGEIIIQGNVREKIIKILKKNGYYVKRIGG